MKPVYYECGICGYAHPWEWNGDCREDAARFICDPWSNDYELRTMDERIAEDNA